VNVGAPRTEGFRVSARLTNGHSAVDVFFAASDGPVAATAETFTSVSLLPAMVLGFDVEVDGALSTEFAAALPRIQQLFHSWEPWYQLVAVEAGRQAPEAPFGTGVGCFFSGGLDSFYTVLRRPDITELIFVHGFDVALDDAGLRAHVVGALRKAAADLGKPLLEVETNVRAFTDRYVDWGWCHMAAQAAVAYVLARRFRKIYISSTHPDEYYANGSAASGSHPLLPQLWSTERVELAQDGREAGRVAKARAVAESELAMRTLRVCWWNPGGAYNCGRCEKCLLTMISLAAIGALERCSTFPDEVSVPALASLSMTQRSSRFFMAENLRALEESGSDPDLTAAVRSCLSRGARCEA
jgi:hypothetical protein